MDFLFAHFLKEAARCGKNRLLVSSVMTHKDRLTDLPASIMIQRHQSIIAS
jgi:hypothetical protein